MAVVRQSDRAFGLTFTVLFALIFVIFYLVFEFDVLWALWVSIAFLVISLFSPSLLLPLNRLWAVLVGKISHFNNHILLGLFFVLFMFPIGIVLRLFGHDPMDRKKDKNEKTYWKKIERHTDSETLKDMF